MLVLDPPEKVLLFAPAVLGSNSLRSPRALFVLLLFITATLSAPLCVRADVQNSSEEETVDSREERGDRWSLNEAIEAALAQHSNIKLARLDVLEANRRAEGDASLFPWTLESQVFYNHSERPVRDNFSDGLQLRDSFDWSTRLIKRWSEGVDLSISLDNNTARTETPLSYNVGGVRVSETSVVGPFHVAVLSASATYHLWAGGDVEVNELPSVLHEMEKTTSLLILEQRASEVLLEVIQAYWELRWRQSEIKVRRATIRSIEHQISITKELIEGGKLAGIEADILEGQLLSGEEALLLTSIAREQAALSLAVLLNAERSGEAKSLEISASDPLPEAPIFEEEAHLIKRARQHSHVLRVLEEQRRAKSIDVLRSEAATDLTLDLQVTLQQQGVDDALSLSEGFILDSYEQIFTLKAGAISAGVIFSMPLDNGAAEAEAAAAHISLDRFDVELEAARLDVDEQVRKTLRGADGLKRRLKLLRRSTGLHQRNLDRGMERFKAGLITVLEVQRLRDTLENANLAQLGVQKELAGQLATLQHLSGSLLSKLGVEVDP